MKRLALLSLVVLLLIGLPLLGIILAGKPLGRYEEFPPITRYVQHAPFSWGLFLILAIFVSATTGPFLLRVLSTARKGAGYGSQCRLSPSASFPWWGWLGTAVLAIAWILAWTRFSWFESWQAFTFSPLWLGYIMVVNALTFRRTGRCMMLQRPAYFFVLFPLSAAFWWYFEYLNRFVQNWYYVGIDSFTPRDYFLYATLPFATVLPAVLGTTQWLATFPCLTRPLSHWRRIRISRPKIVSGVVLLVGTAGLAGLGIWPDVLFAFLWIAPLLVMLSLRVLFSGDHLISDLQRGDWRSVWLPALAGLCCGLLWELWNSKSLAHWQYGVPYVQRFHLFEMPLLGYAGYLPFGIECAVIADLFLARSNREAFANEAPPRPPVGSGRGGGG
ncbi:MAG: hypothetical protein ABJB49_01905 [Nitrospirota bacterium]